MEAEKVRAMLGELLPDMDESTADYFESIVMDLDTIDRTAMKETLAPFIESYGFAEDLEGAEGVCDQLCDKLRDLGMSEGQAAKDDTPQLLDRAVVLSDGQMSELERAAVDSMWGFEKVRKSRNDVMETTEAGSAKYERKEKKEQRKWLHELEASLKEDSDDEDNQISAMTLPDLSGNNRERDIQVNGFSIRYGGHLLLEGADLRLVYGRRYGLIGRNGVGKTTLLKHMANFDIEGFPRHHRVLHVKQEVKASNMSVLQVVLSADVERTALITRERELGEALRELPEDSSAAVQQAVVDEMSEVNERMQLIGVHAAEAKAAVILSGLQFSDEMQQATTGSLSGGWRMRVALAGALLVEPDLLMLDEPTNHLDLEAVLWLEEYLKGYPKTVLLVSHDKAFLNEVCTDIMLFKSLKLNYYKGNYESFECNYREQRVMQQKQHEAQMVKVLHMQEFVDKFRFNAKRAALVQSRIKAIERETVVEAVEDEVSFGFNFFDAGQLGRPIIQIEGVAFGYVKGPTKAQRRDEDGTEEEAEVGAGETGEGEGVEVVVDAGAGGGDTVFRLPTPLPTPDTRLPLFQDVHLGVDQSSRVALVGPNGCGKSTLINLLQGKLSPLTGYIRVNPQLRVGIFTQHHMDSFDLSLSPVQNMAKKWPLVGEMEFRGHLGKYEITGNDAVKPMKFISGGQKSRVAFAFLTYSKPHVVILDEPTNHLDMGAIEALADALNRFSGGVLVVSHDQHFITSVCKEIWVIQNRRVQVFEGEFADYKRQVVSKIRKAAAKRKG
ncbi:P-loop containing nucleoside triphosphate hydrolase protein [Ochromonadaceae sp. CCMP2298]|nr:P-loop containing nucleoside triphosphate hydrolase protein [Ochromonadaceae sp. CCMP2298]